jgi:hypothetical protein
MTKICHSERSEESKKNWKYIPLQLDPRFHGNDNKIVIASVAKQSKKRRQYMDSRFHGNDKKNKLSF